MTYGIAPAPPEGDDFRCVKDGIRPSPFRPQGYRTHPRPPEGRKRRLGKNSRFFRDNRLYVYYVAIQESPVSARQSTPLHTPPRERATYGDMKLAFQPASFDPRHHRPPRRVGGGCLRDGIFPSWTFCSIPGFHAPSHPGTPPRGDDLRDSPSTPRGG